MGCQVGKNQPLRMLQQKLELQESCHSALRVEGCVHALPIQAGLKGATGGTIGYCQALFACAGNPKKQTENVIAALDKIKAPLYMSHELFYGYRNGISPHEFVEQGSAPLLETGRIPVVITGLDPASNFQEIREIVGTKPNIASGESILLRMVLGGKESLPNTITLIQELVRKAEEERQMPRWWPLLQGLLWSREWEDLFEGLGTCTDFLNIAVNPFMPVKQFPLLKDHIVVAQIPIGLADGIKSDGTILMAEGQKITGMVKPEYNLYAYFELLAKLEVAPTLIVLGPCLAGWTDEMNMARVAALLPHLRSACDTLWAGVPKARRAEILKLAA